MLAHNLNEFVTQNDEILKETLDKFRSNTHDAAYANEMNTEDMYEPAGRTDLHVASASGSFSDVVKILGNKSTDILHAKDENNWQAIHEAARGGFLEIVQYLVGSGADVGARTRNGETPLYWARQSLEEGHEVIQYLESIHAPE